MPVTTTRAHAHNNTEGTQMQHTARTRQVNFSISVSLLAHNTSRSLAQRMDSCKETSLPSEMQGTMQSLRADTKYMFPGCYTILLIFHFFSQQEEKTTNTQQVLPVQKLSEVHHKKVRHNIAQQAPYNRIAQQA